MSVFADALDLRTAVVEHVGNPAITDVFPRLVQMAEVGFNRRLRTRDQMTTVSLTVASGVAALPSDFQEVIGVYDGAGIEYIAQPTQAVQGIQTRGYYAIVGGNLVANDETLSLQYYAKVPTISGALSSTNWLLAKHPSLYLYGVGAEAAKHLKDVDNAQATMALLEMEYAEIRAVDSQERYSRARVRVQGVTP